MDIVTTSADEAIAAQLMDERLRFEFQVFGTLPVCRRCTEKCKQYAAPGLVRFVCPHTPDYAAENERLNAGAA